MSDYWDIFYGTYQAAFTARNYSERRKSPIRNDKLSTSGVFPQHLL